MRFAQEISIFNPFAIEKKVIELDTSITQTAREIELRASELYAEKGSVYDLTARLSIMADQITSEVTQRENGDLALSSRITQNANSITSEVANRKSADNSLSSRITQNANSITSEVSARQSADSTLTSKINQTAHTISLSVSGKASKSSGASITVTLKDKNGSQIATDSGSVLIDGNVVFTNQLSTAGQTTINGANITTGIIHDANNNTQFNLGTGELTIKKGTISLGASGNTYKFKVTNAGALTATSGKIGDFTIGTGLYYGKTSVSDARAGIYIGDDGFAVGQSGQYTGFRVDADGTPIANYLAFMNNHGSRSAYGLWCDDYGRIASGGAMWINEEHAQTNYIQSPSIIDGYQRIDSDRRLKKNIRYITPEESEAFIMALKPAEFEFTDEFKDGYSYWDGIRHGFIAQDVLEALGDGARGRSLVSENTYNGMYELKYDELTADLVGICQKQQELISDLERRVSQIENLHDGDGR